MARWVTSADVKELDRTRLEVLMGRAVSRSESAVGRPAWLARQPEVVRVWMTPVDPDTSADRGVHRFITAVAPLSGRGGGSFTVDVDADDYAALSDADALLFGRPAREYVLDLPVVPLDPDQAASWAKVRHRHD